MENDKNTNLKNIFLAVQHLKTTCFLNHNTHFQKDWNIQGLQKHRAHRFLTCRYSWKKTYIKKKKNEKQDWTLEVEINSIFE